MTAHYETKEMVGAIELLVKAARANGIRPVDIKRAIDRRWAGWQTPSLRTIERHLNSSPNIMKKPDTGAKRRSHCKNEPFTFGFYCWAEQGQLAPGRR
jgi:hypothetical protein